MPFVILKHWYYIIIIPPYYYISCSIYAMYDLYVSFSNIQLYYINMYQSFIILNGYFPSTYFLRKHLISSSSILSQP